WGRVGPAPEGTLAGAPDSLCVRLLGGGAPQEGRHRPRASHHPEAVHFRGTGPECDRGALAGGSRPTRGGYWHGLTPRVKTLRTRFPFTTVAVVLSIIALLAALIGHVNLIQWPLDLFDRIEHNEIDDIV